MPQDKSWQENVKEWSQKLPVAKLNAQEDLLQQYMSYTVDQLAALHKQQLGKIAIAISKYIVHLQFEINKLVAHISYYEEQQKLGNRSKAVNDRLRELRMQLKHIRFLPERLDSYKQTIDRYYFSARRD